MDEGKMVLALAALAHEHRLRAFRLLVRSGPSGVAAGDIAGHLNVGPTSLSFHLKTLEHAGLITSTRQGRFVRYAVHVEAMRQLLNYLTEDCCRGQPDLCGSVIKKVGATCK
jgi:DNA-binding transcriptional ArsR family regulator